MKISIRLRYHTRFGRELFICGDHKWFGGGHPEHALPLCYVNQDAISIFQFFKLLCGCIDLAQNEANHFVGRPHEGSDRIATRVFGTEGDEPCLF
jgi:hypothetical protein